MLCDCVPNVYIPHLFWMWRSGYAELSCT